MLPALLWPPVRLQPSNLAPGAGGNQFAVADYFLDQGAIGAVKAGGNKRVFVLEVRPGCRQDMGGIVGSSFGFGESCPACMAA